MRKRLGVRGFQGLEFVRWYFQLSETSYFQGPPSAETYPAALAGSRSGLRHLRVRDRTDDESPGSSHGTLTIDSGEWRLERKWQVSVLSSSLRKPCLLTDRLPKHVLWQKEGKPETLAAAPLLNTGAGNVRYQSLALCPGLDLSPRARFLLGGTSASEADRGPIVGPSSGLPE